MQGDFQSRFVRCLAIYRRLQTSPGSVAKMAVNYGVSVRTIQRDINALTLAGYPIMPVVGKGIYKAEA